MITRRKYKLGEGELVVGYPEVGSRRRTTRGDEMVEEGIGDHPFGYDVGLVDAFMTLRAMVEEMYREFQIAKSKEEERHSSQSGKEDQSDQKDPITSLLNPSKTSKPLLKLDVKFELPMYNGEFYSEKLDNWVKKMEVYCSVQQITEDEVKIRLASLPLTVTSLIYWKSKLHEGTEHISKIFPSWFDFITSLRKQFHPLGYKEKYLIEWKGLKFRKGQSVQEYRDEFRNKVLMLDIPLYTQETLMKYNIGRLPEYVRNIVFIFSPTNLDEVVV